MITAMTEQQMLYSEVSVRPDAAEKKEIRRRYGFIALMMALHVAIYNIAPRLLAIICGAASGGTGSLKQIMTAGQEFENLHDNIFIPLKILLILLSEFIPVMIGMRHFKMSFKDLFRTDTFSQKDVVTSVFSGLGVQSASAIITVIITVIYFFVTGSMLQQPIDNGKMGVFATMIYWIYVCIGAPVMEEIFMRGFLLGSLRKYGDCFAAVFSGLLFGLFHENLYQASYAVPMGIFFAAVALKTKSIVPTILMHSLCNTTNMVMVTWIQYSMGAASTADMTEKIMAGNVTSMFPIVFNLIWRIGFVVAGIVMAVVMLTGKWKIRKATPAGKSRTWGLMLTTPMWIITLLYLIFINIYSLL